MKTKLMLAAVLALFLPLVQVHQARCQTSAQETAAARKKIESEGALVTQAISSHDFETIRRYWSPALIVNDPANLIVGREQVIDSISRGDLNYTSLKSAPEFFMVGNGTAIRMVRESVVMAAGPMAGKHLVRRATEIYQQSRDDWLLVARQATYVGFDGAILSGFVPTRYTAPPPTSESSAISHTDRSKQSSSRPSHRQHGFAALESSGRPAWW